MSDPVTEWSLCSLVFVSFMLIVEPVYSSSFRSIIPPSNWLEFLDSSHPIPEKKKCPFFLPFLARIMDDNFCGFEDDLELVTFFWSLDRDGREDCEWGSKSEIFRKFITASVHQFFSPEFLSFALRAKIKPVESFLFVP